MVTLTFTLSVEAVQALLRPVVGDGGFQSLLRQLQASLDGDKLTLTADLIAKMVRYVPIVADAQCRKLRVAQTLEK